jgi:circadian clock protein KaiC
MVTSINQPRSNSNSKIAARRNGQPKPQALAKTPTGIKGLDEITEGGLPRGRSTLITGGAGCGKTLLGMEFLVRGARDYGEPGVFMAFEENAEELTENVRSLGFDLPEMIQRKQLLIDAVHIQRHEIEETGEYDLEGLFVRLNHAIDSIGAKRIVIDTIEVLFASLSASILRTELRRLFQWLKSKGVTAIVTAERGEGTLTRHGLEEYISDCVILLDHRMHDQVLTRRLRVVKYRGSSHGTNEYPFLIDARGIAVLPITSLSLNHPASADRISTGVTRLDAMLGGKGYYRASSVLVSGTAGAGKSSLAAHFVDAACARGERALYLALEESPSQIVRNMRSIGVDLERWSKNGRLSFHAARPTVYGLELHLAIIHRLVDETKPKVLVVDPVTNLNAVGTDVEVKSTLTRLIDLLKTRGITALFTSLTGDYAHAEHSEIGISSLMDTWILLRNLEHNGERNRGLYVLKARGMTHSNQIREFILTDHGVDLINVYTGPGGVLTGTARVVQEARENAEAFRRQAEIARRRRDLAHKRAALEARSRAEREQFAAYEEDVLKEIAELRMQDETVAQGRLDAAQLRDANGGAKIKRRRPLRARGGNGEDRKEP